MYRIVKRIVHTVTTVTWLVQLADPSLAGKPLEKQITFPTSVSVTEEEVLNTKKSHPKNRRVSKSILDSERRAKQRQSPKRDKGETHE